jgi:fructose-bisphosphate aldolase class II
MPLVSIKNELKRGQNEHFAVPLFDAEDSLSADGFLAAAEARHAPVIIALYTGIMDRPGTQALACYVRERATKSPVPVSLMLDHGAGFEVCMQAITYGFTDIMFDGSKLPFEENVAKTKEIVRAGHALGVAVEAELGHVGQGADYDQFGSQRKGFTEPKMVERFVAETGVDFLAIAIGNAHGVYKGEPDIDIELLKRIRSCTDVPLVLHGGSGIYPDQFRACIREGIAKVNIATDLFMTAGQRMGAAGAAGNQSYRDMVAISVAAFQERCEWHLDLFKTSGKA